MITALHVHRYRCFAEPTRLPLRPLTLVYGPNSAGKSALLRLLPLLREGVEGRLGPWPQGGMVLGDTTFKDVAWSHGLSMRLGFESDRVQGSWDWKRGANESVPSIDRLRLASPAGGEVSLVERLDSAEKRYVVEGDESADDVAITGLLPDIPRSRVGRLVTLCAAIRDELEEVAWVPGRRSAPARRPELRPSPLHPLRWSTEEALLALGQAKRSGDPALSDGVIHFFERLGLHARIELTEPTFSLKVSRQGAGFEVPIADHGEGMGHVLAPLVAAELARLGRGPRLWCIEQPELHLHPDAEIALADRFAAAAAVSSPATLLLETHSPGMLLALRLAVAEGRLPADRVQLLWLRPGRGGASQVSTVELDALGRPGDDWPIDAFRDETKLARRLVERELNRQAPLGVDR